MAAVRGFCDGFTERLVANTKKSNVGSIELVLKKKIGDYQYKLELERREQERRAREAADELRRKLEAGAAEANRKAREEAIRKAEEEAKAKAASEAEIAAARAKAEEEAKAREIQAPVVLDPVIPVQETVVRTETGSSAYQQKRWTFEIIDEALVPRNACSPDAKKIRDMVTAGVRTLPGVKIYEETITKFRA